MHIPPNVLGISFGIAGPRLSHFRFSPRTDHRATSRGVYETGRGSAIEVAPPAVAGVSWFLLFPASPTSAVGAGLAGYLVLMGLMQLRFIPLYARLRFSVATWAFAFSYSAAATDAVLWIAAEDPPGASAWAAVVTAVTTVFIAAIAARTVTALARRQLLAPPATPGPAAPDARQ